MRTLPVFLDLSERPVLLVGAVAAALAKLQILRGRGANIHWYPVTVGRDQAANLATPHSGQLEIIAGEPDETAVASALAVISVGGHETDERLALIARKVRTPINVVDRPELSTFVFPALVDRGEVVIA